MTQKNTPVAIIGAMEQEITLLQSRIAQPQHEKIAHVAITRGTLAGKPILLAQSGIGKVNAAITAFDYVIGQLPQMPARYEADAALVEHAARAAIAFDGAAIHRGLIVSGDQFINHPDKIARIRTHFPDALAVEMEAAAIAQTCYQFARPCVIIRALSDLADGEAEYSFETFLQMAATHSAEMVENLVKAL